MKKFMLHQTGQLAKLRNIAAKIIDPVHEAKRAAHLAFFGQHLSEDFARRFGVAVSASNLSERAAGEILQLRAKIDIVLLRELKRSHHLQRIRLEEIALISVKLALTNSERSQFRFSPAPQR